MIERIQFIEELFKLGLPKNEYIICGSAWLALLGVRKNNDLDLIVSTKLMDEKYGGIMPGVIQGTPFDIQGGHIPHPYSKMFGVKNNDDLVYNHRVYIDGYPFIPFKFYRELKQLDISDEECSRIAKVG